MHSSNDIEIDLLNSVVSGSKPENVLGVIFFDSWVCVLPAIFDELSGDNIGSCPIHEQYRNEILTCSET